MNVARDGLFDRAKGIRQGVLIGGFVTACMMNAVVSFGQEAVVTSLDPDGAMTWTNSGGHGRCCVEWAATPDGPWSRTYQYPGLVERHSNTAVSVEVPAYYRVVCMTNLTPAQLVLVEGGSFERGCHYGYPVLPGPRGIWLSPFYIERFEVNEEVWQEVRDWGLTNGYTDLPVGSGGGSVTTPHRPIADVSWYDVIKWCNARSEKADLTPVYYQDFFLSTVYRTGTTDVQNTWVAWNSDGYRLPTEAEWEKAARGGLTGHHYPWRSYGGSYWDHMEKSYANSGYLGGMYGSRIPVGSYNGSQRPDGHDMANGFGLYDMAGNVREWVWDLYDSSLNYYQTCPTNNPKGYDGGTERIVRGGSFLSGLDDLTVYSIESIAPTTAEEGTGFRCVRAK